MITACKRDPAPANHASSAGGWCSALACRNDFINQSIGGRFFGGHKVVTLGVALDFLEVLARAFCQNAVENATQTQDFTRVNLNVRGLPLRTAQRLVNHNA